MKIRLWTLKQTSLYGDTLYCKTEEANNMCVLWVTQRESLRRQTLCRSLGFRAWETSSHIYRTPFGGGGSNTNQQLFKTFKTLLMSHKIFFILVPAYIRKIRHKYAYYCADPWPMSRPRKFQQLWNSCNLWGLKTFGNFQPCWMC